MQNRGYKALLVIVGAVVVVALFLAYVNYGNLSSVMSRADSTLRNGPTRQFDTTRYKSKFPPRKSRQVLSIELNSADSVTLCRVYGIGATFARRIIARRAALGGYYTVEQLLEVRGIDGEVYERIAKNFYVDTARIIKININFATREVLTSHPYITPSMARRIERARMEGGYITHDKELIDRNILLPKEALRVTLYLLFETIENR